MNTHKPFIEFILIKIFFFHLLHKKVDPYTYCKIASSRPVYYSILDSFRSQYKSIKFFFISSLKIQKCATNQDSLSTARDFTVVIFYKTEIQTVALRCLISLNLNWYKSYDTKRKNTKNTIFFF